MSNTIYNEAKARMQNGGLDLDTDTIKVLAIAGTGALDPDHGTVAAVLAASAELSTTGYTGGAGGSGRKTVTMAVTKDNANDRSDAVSNSQTWSAVSAGSAPNDKIQKFLFYKHVSSSDDTLNIPIFAVDTASGLPFTLNGSDVQLAAQTLRLA